MNEAPKYYGVYLQRLTATFNKEQNAIKILTDINHHFHTIDNQTDKTIAVIATEIFTGYDKKYLKNTHALIREIEKFINIFYTTESFKVRNIYSSIMSKAWNAKDNESGRALLNSSIPHNPDKKKIEEPGWMQKKFNALLTWVLLS